jgi:hypothetical protein
VGITKKLPVKKVAATKPADPPKKKTIKVVPKKVIKKKVVKTVVKKTVRRVIKPPVRKTVSKARPTGNTNKPPAVNREEIALCMEGKWLAAAKTHQKRTGVMFRRSLTAVAIVYRNRLQEVLAAIKTELSEGR